MRLLRPTRAVKCVVPRLVKDTNLFRQSHSFLSLHPQENDGVRGILIHLLPYMQLEDEAEEKKSHTY